MYIYRPHSSNRSAATLGEASNIIRTLHDADVLFKFKVFNQKASMRGHTYKVGDVAMPKWQEFEHAPRIKEAGSEFLWTI